MRRRGLYTYLEDNGVCMREGHCLRGLGSAEECTEKRMLMDQLITMQGKVSQSTNFHENSILPCVALDSC